MTNADAENIIEEAAAKLGEHFDAVQILCSWRNPQHGSTCCSKKGVGNWYARQGMAHEFINEDMAQDAAVKIAEQLKDEPDGSDDWKAVL